MRFASCCSMTLRICSRPGFVPTPTPMVTATTKMIVMSVNTLTRTTRWRRFIELEVGSDRESERESLEQPGARRWNEVVSAASLVDGLEHPAYLAVEHLVAG